METTPPTRNPKRQRKKEGAQARRAAELAALRRQRRNRRIVRFAVIAVIAVAAVFIWSWAGGDDDDDPDVADSGTTTTEATETTLAAPATAPECEGPSGENTDTSTKPTVVPPDEPATELLCQDLVVGDGDEITSPTSTVKVHYVGVGQITKQEFDASWGGEPASFPLDGVIAGWTQGMIGMKEGGRRLLTIPGDLAYGPGGRPGIEPDETLVFVIDLLEVDPAE